MFVSIIIPTCNHLSDCLRPCIKSIIQYTDLNDIEILVVANGCTDDTKSYLKELQKINLSIRQIWIEERVGFTKSINAGIKASRGDFIVLLNNDTVLKAQPKNQWIDMLSIPFESSSVGITGPIKFAWSAGIREYEVIAFWCAMIRSSVFEKVGLLDEVFGPGCGDDVDFSIRAHVAGYRLVQVPEQKEAGALLSSDNDSLFPIDHRYGVTLADDYYEKYLLLERNGRILEEKYSGLSVKSAEPENTLEAVYRGSLLSICDIHEHLPVLRKLAAECNHVTEFGVRDVCSTYALLAGRPKILKSYDLHASKEIVHAYELASIHKTDFQFIKGNTLEVEIEPTEMLFIDTKHTYDQLRQELNLHAHKSSRYIAMHDTVTYGHKGEDDTSGLWPAVVEFLRDNQEWCIKAHYTNNNGLTVLERSKKPTYSSRIDPRNICFSE